MTLANKITVIRILLIPVFIITFINGLFPWHAIIFSLMIITDALDGFIARHRKQITPLGTFLDPMADKLMMFASYLAGAYLGLIPVWVFVVILSRDVLIVLGWAITYFITDSTDINPRLSGKLTTIFQMTTIWFIILNVLPGRFINLLLYATVIVTAVSGVDYIIFGNKRLNKNA
ncbi:MAG: CDP-alcohol phosphatidyltransferase family protein [Endomicrobiales bacterium]|nr:CDP-alcohol phosphatidyltransferase family protein [Endomicrobiales bacterium]